MEENGHVSTYQRDAGADYDVYMGEDEAEDSDFEYLPLPGPGLDYTDEKTNENITPEAIPLCPRETASRLPFTTIHQPAVPFDADDRACFVPGIRIDVEITDVVHSDTKVLNPNLYTIQLKHGDFQWTVKKRYKHFRSLHDNLLLYRAKLKIPVPTRLHRQRRRSFMHRRNILPRFPRRPEAFVRDEDIDERKKQLADYLRSVLRIEQFRNYHETVRFLEVSHLSFVFGLGAKNREGLVKKRSGGRSMKGWCACCGRCLQNITAHYNKRWLVLKDTFLAYINPAKGTISDVLLMDGAFDVQCGFINTGIHHGMVITTLSRQLVLKCWTQRKAQEWKDAILDVAHTVGKDFTTPNRYKSFAPLRMNSHAQWFVDGSSYMSAVADAMEAAKEEIFITDWWLSPEIYMKRPMTEGDRWRLDVILKRKAMDGVRIFVVLFKEMEMALGINSYYTKQALMKLHPTNIKVLRHPDYISMWSHHEKMVVIDQRIAFLGGIDLCYGRYDTPEHRLTDLGSILTSPELMASQRDHAELRQRRDSLEHDESDMSTLEVSPGYGRSISSHSWPETEIDRRKLNLHRQISDLGHDLDDVDGTKSHLEPISENPAGPVPQVVLQAPGVNMTNSTTDGGSTGMNTPGVKAKPVLRQARVDSDGPPITEAPSTERPATSHPNNGHVNHAGSKHEIVDDNLPIRSPNVQPMTSTPRSPSDQGQRSGEESHAETNNNAAKNTKEKSTAEGANQTTWQKLKAVKLLNRWHPEQSPGMKRPKRPPNLNLRPALLRQNRLDGTESTNSSPGDGHEFLAAFSFGPQPSTPKPRKKIVQKAHDLKLEVKERFRKKQSKSVDVANDTDLDFDFSNFYKTFDEPSDPDVILEGLGLEGSSKIWIGKDYCNFISKDFTELDKPFTDLLDRTKTPRMPWHDIGAVVYGKAARDVARHFIQRWNFTKVQKRKTNMGYPLILPKAYTKVTIPRGVLASSIPCNIQFLRSVSNWSAGVAETEASIHSAYIDIIQNAKHYVYIENQFFISVAGSDQVSNDIANALYHRIMRAHKNGDVFRVYVVMPLLPAFVGELGKSTGGAIQAITHWNYASISRGGKSLLERLESDVPDPREYITFYGLRTHNDLGGHPITELVYVHSKLMIVDDRSVIIGSANINDRSLLGKRDSEIAVLIEDTHMRRSRMNGEDFEAGWFASSLRKSLFREHLGVKAPSDVDITDPVCPDFYKGIWITQASINTTVYDKVFHCIPSDAVRKFSDIQGYVSSGALVQTNEPEARELLTKISGHLVFMPLHFLCDENVQPTVATKEGLVPATMWT